MLFFDPQFGPFSLETRITGAVPSNMEVGKMLNVAPLLMMGGPPPPEQLPFLINAAASPKFAAQLKSYGPLESI